MNPVKNLFANTSDNQRDELIETIIQKAGLRIEKIVSHDHCSPEGFWYDQDENEWVILLKGSAGLRFDDQEDVFILVPGDYLHIDRRQRHRVEWTDPEQDTIWLAVHYK